MNISSLQNVSALNNAYIVVGTIPDNRNEVMALLQKRGVSMSGNPDVYEFSDSEFSVDDARAVSSFASLKPYGDAKYFLLAMSRATAEAQNALLKVIEEAPGSSVFFFIVESAGHLLPTIRSRCIQVIGQRVEAEESTVDALKFLKDTYESRLTRVEKITSYITKTQDRAPSRAFVGALLKSAKEKQYPTQNMRDILDADRYMRMQGSSAKAVLSHLAVTLPRG